MDSKPEIYCLAPWIHAFLNTKGNRNFCCFRDFEPDGKSASGMMSLKEYWNSEKVMSDRRLMLEGIAPKECIPCTSRVLFNDQPRNFFFSSYRLLTEEIRKQTDENGFTDFSPRFFDYRFSNTCNFACRTCAPGSSSRIEREEREIIPEQFSKLEINQTRQEFNRDNVLSELLGAIRRGEVDKLYWGGGEPLLLDEHWQIMNTAIECGHASKIDVVYSTNMSSMKYRSNNLLNIIDHFGSVEILASLDGVGEVGEYIRKGLDWSKFQQNIRQLQEQGKAKIVITLTMTLPGLLHIKEFAQYLLNENLSYESHICHSNGPNDLMSPLILPREILDSVIDKSIQEINSLPHSGFLDELIRNIEKLKTEQTIREKFKGDFDKGFKACRWLFLQKEKNDKMSLEKIFSRKNKTVCNWWTEGIDKEKPPVYDTLTRDWEAWLAKYIRNNEKIFFYANRQIDPKEKYQQILIKNNFHLCDNQTEQFEKLYNSIERGGQLMAITPAVTPLNYWLNRKVPTHYEKKIWLVKQALSDKRFNLEEVFLLSPWSFLLQARFPWFRDSFIKRLGRVLSPLNKYLSLHQIVVLRKK